jgi:ABC-type uncharacterized transport system substrate-binding protein
LLKAIKNNKPVFGLNKWAVKNGALFCLSADYRELGKQVAKLIGQSNDDNAPKPHQYPQSPKLFANGAMVNMYSSYTEINIPSRALVLK